MHVFNSLAVAFKPLTNAPRVLVAKIKTNMTRCNAQTIVTFRVTVSMLLIGASLFDMSNARVLNVGARNKLCSISAAGAKLE